MRPRAKNHASLTLLSSCALLGAAACAASHENFRPTENVYGETPEGYADATYELIAGRGQRVGQAKTFSKGAVRQNDQTVLHVDFELDATGTVALQLVQSALRLESVQTTDRTLTGLEPTRFSGQTEAAPGRASTAQADFVLPHEIKPTDVRAFRVEWTVAVGPTLYTEFTPFVVDEIQDVYVPVYGYYYPFYPYEYPYYYPAWVVRPRRVTYVPPYRRIGILPHARGRWRH